MANPRVHDVYVIKRGAGAMVWPPFLAAKGKDWIRFTTVGVSAKIEFPYDGPFERDPSPPSHHPTPENPSWVGVENLQGGPEAAVRVGLNKSTVIRLNDGDSARTELGSTDGTFGATAREMLHGPNQIYAYSVFCREINDYAVGNSSPVIMIEPPEKPGP